MKIVIKPLGIAFVGVGLTAVAALAVRSATAPYPDKLEVPRPSPVLAASATPENPSAPVASAAVALPITLPYHDGFEGAFKAVATRSNQKALIGGEVAPNWEDSFWWNETEVVYADNTDSPHSGKHCQRMTVKSVRSGVAGIWQTVKLPTAGTYRASVFVRGTEGTPVTFILRDHTVLSKVIATKEVLCTGAWQRIEISGVGNAGQIASLVVQTARVGVLDLDDVTIEKGK